MKTFKEFMAEGDVVAFSRTSTPSYGKKINKTTLPNEEGKLNKGQIVFRSTHTLSDDTPKVHYGEVVHHNKKEATVHWDDGTVIKHNREHGAAPAHMFKDGDTQPRVHWTARAIDAKHSGTPGVKTREEHKREYSAFTKQTHWKYYGRHEGARTEAFNDVTNALTKSGIAHHNSGPAEGSYDREHIFHVNTPNHNEITSALTNAGWDHKQSEDGLRHSYTKKTKLGTLKAWHHDNALINPVNDKYHADRGTKPLEINKSVFDGMVRKLGMHTPDSSKTPGWRHAKVRLWVSAEGNSETK